MTSISRIFLLAVLIVALTIPMFAIGGGIDSSAQRRDGSMLWDVFFHVDDFSDCVDVGLLAVTQSGESLLVSTFIESSDTGTICEPGSYHLIWDIGTDVPNREFYSDSIIISLWVAITGIVPGDCDCPPVEVDIDGNAYETVLIGTQCWMAENLKTTRYRDGTAIPHVTVNSEWEGLDSPETGAYCEYGNDPANVATYGRLYNWYAVVDARGLCPPGWRVPSDDDFKVLEIYLGMDPTEADGTLWRGTNQGSQLVGEYDLWSSGSLRDNPAFGTSGFTALPGGYRTTNGFYYTMTTSATFWSSSEYSSAHAWYRTLTYYYTNVHRRNFNKRYGFSVRCLRD